MSGTYLKVLSGVAAAVAQAYASGVWTTAEVLQAREVRSHWFLELAERLATGEVARIDAVEKALQEAMGGVRVSGGIDGDRTAAMGNDLGH